MMSGSVGGQAYMAAILAINHQLVGFFTILRNMVRRSSRQVPVDCECPVDLGVDDQPLRPH